MPVIVKTVYRFRGKNRVMIRNLLTRLQQESAWRIRHTNGPIINSFIDPAAVALMIIGCQAALAQKDPVP